MDTSSVRYSLADVVAGCRNERSMYRADQPAASPLCVELFKRAFAGDPEAWAEVRTVFERHMRAWIGIQRVIEPEDAIQEAFLSFYRSAPHQPSLVATDDLSRVLSYLRGCVKTAILMLLRKQRFATAPFDTLPDLEAPGDFSQTAELRAILLDRVRALLQTAEEQIVFQLYFLREMKPQEIRRRRYPDERNRKRHEML